MTTMRSFAAALTLLLVGCSCGTTTSDPAPREQAGGERVTEGETQTEVVADPGGAEEPVADPGGGEEPVADPGGGEEPGVDEPSEQAGTTTPVPTSGWFSRPRASARIFGTGHSLIDHVMAPPDHDGGPLAEIARRAGKTHMSVFQGGPGSPARLRREDIEQRVYPEPRWASFDTVIVTERADPHATVIWERSAQEMGWFVEHVQRASRARPEVFVYQTWWGFSDQNPPTLRTWREWATYVREELPLHECIAEQMAHARGIPVRVLPAGLALAEMMESIEARRVPGASVYDFIARDHVHAADLGHTFLALVVFASIYRTPVADIELPGVRPEVARAMREIADRVVSTYYASERRHTLAACRQTLAHICRRHEQDCDYHLDRGFPDGSI